jgi:hypothetical protein
MLQVGDPPLQDNGLPAHFTLGASSSLSKSLTSLRVGSSSTSSSNFHHKSGGIFEDGDDKHVPPSSASTTSTASSSLMKGNASLALKELNGSNNNSRQNTSRSSLNDSHSVSQYNEGSNFNGRGGNGSLSSLANHNKKINRAELPPADRMHVTLFFRSL